MSREALMPQSRAEGLVIQDFSKETLVYDARSHKAHCLNRTAVLVWRMCDGRTTVAEAARRLHNDTGLPSEERIVRMAVDQLAKAKLVEGSLLPEPGTNRRQALKRIGLAGSAAALLPLITSIVAPTAVAAATCLATGAVCTSSAQCCSGLCRTVNNRCA